MKIIKNTGKKIVATVPETKHAYYIGKHPHLLNSMGVTYYDELHAQWLYRPESIHSEWYRVHRESLEFEQIPNRAEKS